MGKSLVELLRDRDSKPAAKPKVTSKSASSSKDVAGAGGGQPSGSSGDGKLQKIYGKSKAASKPKAKPKSVMKTPKTMKKGSGSKGAATGGKQKGSRDAPAVSHDGGSDCIMGDDDMDDDEAPASKKTL